MYEGLGAILILIAFAYVFATAFFSAAIAASKNRSETGWFLLGLFFGPLALFSVGFMPKLEEQI